MINAVPDTDDMFPAASVNAIVKPDPAYSPVDLLNTASYSGSTRSFGSSKYFLEFVGGILVIIN